MKQNICNRLMALWALAMRNHHLDSDAKQHIERVLADEYRMQQVAA